MNIECKLKRQGGTKVDLGGTEYHFEPLTDGRHVAFVENEEHRDRFLSISEAYRVATDVPAATKIELPAAVAAIVAPVESEGDDEAPADTSELRRLLAEQYREKFGKAPHGKWSVEKINEALQAA